MTPFLLVLCVLALIAYLVITARDRPPNFPPGPPSLPLWGGYWFVLARNAKYPFKGLLKLSEDYDSPVIGMKYGSANVIIANDYDSVREALLKPEFQGRPDGFGFRLRSFGRLLGITFSDGPFWKAQKRFSLRHMRDFGFGRRSPKLEGMTSEYIDDFVYLLNSNLRSHVAYDDNLKTDKESSEMLLPDAFLTAPTSAFVGVLTGDSLPMEDQKAVRDFAREALTFQRVNETGGGAFNITPWLRFFAPETIGYRPTVTAINKTNVFTQKLYDSFNSTFAPGDDRSFIDRYITEMKKLQGTRSSFSEKQLIMTITDFMFAASSTISVTMTLALLRLVEHPEIATKIREEIDHFVGRSRAPSLDDRQNLHYFEAFLREVMRYDTLLPLSLTHRATQDTTFRNYFIPKNTLMLVNVWAAHRDPKVFQNPQEFRPGRFLDSRNKLLTKDLTMSFGLGQRLCAGETFARQVMFLFLTTFIQNFEFSAPQGKKLPDLDNLLSGIVLSPPDFWLKVTPRTH